MAAGLSVRVASGQNLGAVGTILDADYISGRALVRFDETAREVWIAFPDLAAAGDLKSTR